MASESAPGTNSGKELREQQEESSSSSHSECDPTEELTLESNTQIDNEVKPVTDELTAFRQQWLQELDSIPFTPGQKATASHIAHAKVSAGSGASSGASSAREGSGKKQKTFPPKATGTSVADAEDKLQHLHLNNEQTEPVDKSRHEDPNQLQHKRRRKFDPRTPDAEKAKQFYLRGLVLERGGKLYAAIPYYKRAIQLKPDIERQITNSSAVRLLTEDAPGTSSGLKILTPKVIIYPSLHRGGDLAKDKKLDEASSDSDVEEEVEGEGLVSRLHRILLSKGRLFRPAQRSEGAHISCLPYELVQLVLSWVVGAQLDAGSLERAASSCRGFYVVAREPELWRRMCVQTWGKKCGTPADKGYADWRHMYVERARPLLHGCYISKTTYMRPGENTFQDSAYQSWQYIDYYRYLRFFSDGAVLVWTTTQPPAACVARLKHREVKNSVGVVGILSGHYRLKGDMVVILVKKARSEKAPASNALHKDTGERHAQVYQMELKLRPLQGCRNGKLSWRSYAVATSRDQWTSIELAPGRFPPFSFSPVRAYTAETCAPLPEHKV